MTIVRTTILIVLVSLLMGNGRLAKFQLAASHSANQNSSVGVNLGASGGSHSGVPFPYLNELKLATGWNTLTAESVGLYRYGVDANGYPLSLAVGALTGTFTGSISNQSGGSGVSAGTIVDVTALLTGNPPWDGGQLTGTGVSATRMSPSAGTGTCSTSGSTLTVSSAGGVWGRGQLVYLAASNSEGQQVGTITANGTGTSGNGTYTLNTSPSPAVSSHTCASIQPQGTTGTYLSSVSQAVSSKTLTEKNQYTSVRTETFLPTCLTAGLSPQPDCYPQGKYVLAWDGLGTVTMNTDFTAASCPSCGTNRLLYNASGTSGGQLTISSTTLGNNATNIRLIYCPDCADGVGGSTTAGVNGTGTREALYNRNVANGITWGGFDPVFLAAVQKYRGFRFMDWFEIVSGNIARDWTDARPANWVFYNDSRAMPLNYGGQPDPANGAATDGVPPTVALELCKELNADCYLNTPKTASVNYVTNLASLALSMLPSTVHVYYESGNEFWHPNSPACQSNTLSGNGFGSGTMTEWCATQVGDIMCTLTGFCGNGNFSENLFYGGESTAYFCNQWKAVWAGRTSQVSCVWSGQNGCVGCVASILDQTSSGAGLPYTGTVGQNIDAVGLAPYMGIGMFGFIDALSADADFGVQRLMDEFQTGTFPTTTMGTTTGTSTVYAVTTGLSLSGSPANGTMICVTPHTPNGSSATIAVDTMAAAPLQINDGSLTGTPLTAGTFNTSLYGANLLSWTKAVAGGTPTPGWRWNGPCDLAGNAGMPIPSLFVFSALWPTYLAAHYPALVIVGYEGGNQTGGNTTNAIAAQQFFDVWRSTQSGPFYTAYLDAWRNLSTSTEMFLYNEFSPTTQRSDGGTFFAFGNLENGLQTSSPRYNAVQTWNATHNCWWAGCSN